MQSNLGGLDRVEKSDTCGGIDRSAPAQAQESVLLVTEHRGISTLKKKKVKNVPLILYE